MLPFALKVVWFCLSLTGTIVCWAVEYMFAQAISSYWGPALYSIFAAILQGMFCLGMIYDMNPIQMPKAFCIVQTFVIYYSAWTLTGVCATFTYATSSTVLWPSPMKRSDASILAWKNKYYFPILIFPLACLSVSLPVLLHVDAIEPTDDLHCDASNPEWGRFLGYAGFPMILTIPCLFLSAVAARRASQLHRSTQHLGSQLSNKRDATSGRRASAVISPDNTTPAFVDSEAQYSAQPTAGADVQDMVLSSCRKQSKTGMIEEGDECDLQGQMRGIMLSSMTSVVPPPKVNIAPAIWRLILFQLTFFVTQCLAALSTIIDVARHRPTPTPFGSQHVALVLVGWGPAFVLGHAPAVRRRLMFWKKVDERE